ncbi:tetratricopeptide repeat protein [Pelagibacterium luteolum]|uniref:Uncharacterized protein n=1 Tax=Pelagibacterium luteolum TaxID=440168 RepID=A0A1G7UU09_9HYPH|nr:hypothetical protein [Pelagibacterium luteolum]SDG50761.1 hypothetical protein SAMN04487974_103264 [Pelagibacterium luteolum]
MPDRDVSGIAAEADVRAALAELTAWEPLRRSPQISAFLTYIVDAALRGESDTIKAYAIAVDVFGRSEDFDPQTDPIVRVQARRLRQLLDRFDADGLGQAPVRILIPRGRYVPEFLLRTTSPAPLLPSEESGQAADARLPQTPSRSIWVAGAIAVLVLMAALYFWPELGRRTAQGPPQPQAPLLIVEEFENHTEDDRGTPLVAGLAVELVSILNFFPDLAARYGGQQAATSDADRAVSDRIYILSGVARRAPRGILYSVVLRAQPQDTIRASFEVEVPLAAGAPTLSLQEVATRFALRLGSPRGPMHADVRAWLAGDGVAVSVLEYYPCLAGFAAFRERRVERDPAPLLDCAEVAAREGHAEGLAMAGFLTSDMGWRSGADTQEGELALRDGIALAEAAIERDPMSAFSWAQRGYVAFLAGEVGRARDLFSTAMQINPAMVDVVADYAYINALTGNWDTANAYSELAMTADPDPPNFYFTVPALDALRNAEYELAAQLGERMVEGLPDLGAAFMVAVGGQLRDAEIINRYMPRLLASQRYRRLGVMPALREHISDPEILRQLSAGLLQAGMPLDRLAQPF